MLRLEKTPVVFIGGEYAAFGILEKKEKREEDGKKLALFNSAGHLELAVYKSNPLTVGSASSLFGLDYRDPVTIKFD